MSKIYIYEDYIHNNATLRKRLSDGIENHTIISVDAHDILHDLILEKSPPALFVMPGGADLYYLEKLGAEGCNLIKTYVENGGSYLGICAGAYFACDHISWADDFPKQTIKGERFLKFHKGKATGPIHRYILNGDISHSCDAVASITTVNGVTFKALYRAGPVFEEGHGENVLARYTDIAGTPPAIIQTKVGKGFALLMSPHLEFLSHDWAQNTYKNQNATHNHDFRLIEGLKKYDQQINDTWKSLVRKALSRSVIRT